MDMINRNLLSHINTAMADYFPLPPHWTHPATATASVSSSIPPSSRRSAAAVTIQSAARGLLARKSLRDLQALEAEVDAIERRVCRSIDLLLSDETERIRINEMLMAVLLRVDAVRGVREYRRKVIRRAISLQESLDAMAAEEQRPDGETLGVMEENESLRGMVKELSGRVGELERKLRRLGRRRRWRRRALVVRQKVAA